MKRKVVLVAGMAALAIGLYVGARVSAVDSQPAPASGGTRIAVMNMQKVANEYLKTTDLKKRLEADGAVFDKELKEIQNEMQRYNPLPTDPAKAEDAQKQLTALRRKAEDKQNEGKKVMAEKYTEGEKVIFKDIEAAVQVYAHSRNIDLVMFYNDVDAKDDAQRYSAQAMTRRLGSSGMPIYSSAGTDISAEVVHVLNWNYQNNPANAPKGSGSH